MSPAAAQPSAAALAMERQLRTEAQQWEACADAAALPLAEEADLPVLDLGPYLQAMRQNGQPLDDTPGEQLQQPKQVSVAPEGEHRAAATLLESSRSHLAAELKQACEQVDFHYVINHGIPPEVLQSGVAAARRFFALPLALKHRYQMDSDGRAGVGYLGVKHQKLPSRDKPNLNECFIVKRELGPRNITLESMPWPQDIDPSGGETPEAYDQPLGTSEHDDGYSAAAFRRSVLRCCQEMEDLSMAMLPIYASALDLPADYFATAFRSPLFRFRLSRYPSTPPGEFGINPHVDTSFFTLLFTTGPGLVFYSARRGCFVRALHKPDALIVNTGQLLSQLTNDKWIATRHYALNPSDGESRYSLPFFFNATADFKMPVVPTCCSAEEPPKYTPTSYLDSQGVAQGE